ncbi:hypothetical protein TNCV_2833341 [Trichonephila clavipes]|nr:hypothetical protein TNCV_2833341 [Trichonephila clavipes]
MNKIRKTPGTLDFLIIYSEEFIAVGQGIMADKDILEFFKNSKNIIDANSDDENEMNNAATVPISSEMRNITKNMHSYLDAHFSHETNNDLDDIEQYVDNLMPE